MGSGTNQQNLQCLVSQDFQCQQIRKQLINLCRYKWTLPKALMKKGDNGARSQWYTRINVWSWRWAGHRHYSVQSSCSSKWSWQCHNSPSGHWCGRHSYFSLQSASKILRWKHGLLDLSHQVTKLGWQHRSALITFHAFMGLNSVTVCDKDAY